MTTEQTTTNLIIDESMYRLQQTTITLNQLKQSLKQLRDVNKVKHHQTLMNIDYAHEILSRSTTLLNELKHN